MCSNEFLEIRCKCVERLNFLRRIGCVRVRVETRFCLYAFFRLSFVLKSEPYLPHTTEYPFDMLPNFLSLQLPLRLILSKHLTKSTHTHAAPVNIGAHFTRFQFDRMQCASLDKNEYRCKAERKKKYRHISNGPNAVLYHTHAARTTQTKQTRKPYSPHRLYRASVA